MFKNLKDKRSIFKTLSFISASQRRIFFLGLALIILGGWILSVEFFDDVKQEIYNTELVSAQTIAINFSESLLVVEHAAEVMADYPSMRQALKSADPESLRAVNNDLDRVNDIMNTAVCYLMDINGRTIASSNRGSADSFIDSYYNFRPYFQNAVKSGKGNYFALGVTSGIRGYYISRAVKDRSGNIIGVAAIKKDLDFLEQALEKHKYAFIVNQDGLIFLANKKEFLGNSLWPISAERQEQIIAGKQFGRPSFNPLNKKQFENKQVVSHKNKKLIAVLIRMENTDWSLVLLTSISQASLIAVFGIIGTILLIILWVGGFAWIVQKGYADIILRKSEENYRAIFDSVQDAIFVLDPESGQILDVNKTMCLLYGYESVEAVKLSVGQLSADTPPYTQEEALKYISKAVNAQTQQFEWLCKTKNNQLFWADITLLKCELGGKQRLLATVRDITQSKKAAQLLAEEYARTQRYLDIVGVLIVVLNADKTIGLINRKGCEVLGYPEKELIGRNWIESFMPPDNRQANSEQFDKLIQGEMKDTGYYESEIITSSGQRRLIAWKNILLKNSNNDITGTLSSGEDITDKKKQEQDIFQASKRYEQLAKELEQGQAATLNILEDLQEAKETLEISRQNFLNIIEKSTDSVLIVDDQGIVKFANPSALTLFGRSSEEMIGFPFGIDIAKQGIKEITIKSADGSYKITEMRTVNTEWQEKTMTLVLLHDMTERKNAENSLRIAAHEWRVTFDSIGHGLSLLDLDGKIVRCNKALTNFVDMTYLEIIGMDCHQLIHGQESDGLCPIHDTLKTKQRSTKVLQRGDKWLSLSVDPLLNQENELIGLIHSVIDLTDQKMIEQKLREYTDYVENIIENAQAIIVSMDENLNIKTINAFAENLTGREREDIINHDWLGILIPEEYKDEIIQVLTNCLEGDRVKGYEIPILAKDNKEVMVSWDSSELRDAEGQITGIVLMGYDISQRKEVEKVQRLAQLGTLVSHMAHEVNNPLMVISGRAQLSLMEEIDNPEVKANLDIVMKECQRAKEIIQRLLRFSRPSKGELKPTDVNASLIELVELVEHQFGLNNVLIKKDYAPELPPVLVDEKQIHEVFMNLLTNAQDAISGEGTIKIKTRLEGDSIKITIADSGEGISKEVLDKIFDPFFTTKKKGTGLGLSICYSIIKAHNGNLSFESLPGQGTTAVIILPYMQENKDV